MTFTKDLTVPGTHPKEKVELGIKELVPDGCLCTWSYHATTKTLKYINMACPLHVSMAERDTTRHIYIQDWQGLYEKNNGHKERKRGRPRKSPSVPNVGATDITIQR